MTRPALLSLDDALPQLLAHAQALQRIETLSTFDADGRVLAKDVMASSGAREAEMRANMAARVTLNSIASASAEVCGVRSGPLHRPFTSPRKNLAPWENAPHGAWDSGSLADPLHAK